MTRPARVALETTLLLHGVPRAHAQSLRRELEQIVRAAGATPALVGVVAGRPMVGMDDAAFELLLADPGVPKLNTSNLGAVLSRAGHGATTVSTTMELAARAGVRVFATGGLGGVHRGYAHHLDISADLVALSRFPLGVVASGVKSILDVPATRELLETLGIPIVGFRTDHFPAFYLRATDPPLAVDARFDDVRLLARFVARELARTSRGVLIANPIGTPDELDRGAWNTWLDTAQRDAAAKNIGGRDWTPFILGRVHELSGGATLRANIALVKSNARLAAEVAAAI